MSATEPNHVASEIEATKPAQSSQPEPLRSPLKPFVWIVLVLLAVLIFGALDR